MSSWLSSVRDKTSFFFKLDFLFCDFFSLRIFFFLVGVGAADGSCSVNSVSLDFVKPDFPALIIPSRAPTSTVSPSFTLIEDNVPLNGEGTSTLTLSVSNSTKGSSESTWSPTFFSHLDTVASVIDSPSDGTTI